MVMAHTNTNQTWKTKGHGLAVIALTFYSNNSSLNPTEVYLQFLFRKNV